MNLENIMPAERIQSQDTTYDPIYRKYLEEVHLCIETESGLAIAEGWIKEWEDRGVIAKGYRVSFSGDKNVLNLIVMIVAHICGYSKNH